MKRQYSKDTAKPLTSQGKKLRVVELFAGVGGFRIGLEHGGRGAKYSIVWSNQWEPGAKIQHASNVYKERFGEDDHSNEDIAQVVKEKFHEIPHHDLLVGGFPCQDYSVARTLNQAAGLVGKKGVLWWEIHKILAKKKEAGKPVRFLMLENVDRLLKSPSSMRGRDFAIMLSSLASLGYVVEWRVINAADYGMPQRRRRVYILGYYKGTRPEREIRKTTPIVWLTKLGTIANEFPVQESSTDDIRSFQLSRDLAEISKNFETIKGKSPFENAGFMIDWRVSTTKTHADYNGRRVTLGEIILDDEKLIPEKFFIKDADLPRWTYLKGGKKEKRKGKDGFTYNYNEGPVAFPDSLDKPSRTMVTGEGGSGPSRFKHVIKTKSGRYRRLTPLELERLNMFPDDHTKHEGVTDIMRAFFMGNALVVGVIKKLGESLARKI